MQIENDYDKEVYNGDIGTVDDVEPNVGELAVSFDGRSVKLPPEDRGSYFAQTIDRYCDDAWAVKDFLRYNNVQRS